MSQPTERALGSSLKKLLEKKPLDKVTINDITEDCGLNRMTFYYHFRDIYDLVEWICVEDITKAVEGKSTYDTWQEGLLEIFNVVSSNKTFVMNIYRSVGREQVETCLYKLTFDLFIGIVNERARGTNISDSDKKFITEFYGYAFVGVLLDWIKDDMKKDPHMIINKLASIMHGNFTRALHACQKDTDH